MTDDHRYAEIDPELRAVAQRVADALRAEVPPEVAARHEALLRERATGGVVRPLPGRRRGRRRTLVALVAAALLMAGPAAVAVVSDAAIPGDLLYGVDRAVERLELVLARGDSDQARAHLTHAAERLTEIEALARTDRDEDVPEVLGAFQASTDEALAAARASSRQDVIDLVQDALDRHLERLEQVRDRLAAGRASPVAVAALDRVLDRAREAPARGRPSGQEGGPPEERPGRTPPRTGPPSGEAPGSRPDDPGSQQSGGPPAAPPAGPDTGSQGGEQGQGVSQQQAGQGGEDRRPDEPPVPEGPPSGSPGRP